MSSDEISDMLNNISSEVHRMIDRYDVEYANAFRSDFDSLMYQYCSKVSAENLGGLRRGSPGSRADLEWGNLQLEILREMHRRRQADN